MWFFFNELLVCANSNIILGMAVLWSLLILLIAIFISKKGKGGFIKLRDVYFIFRAIMAIIIFVADNRIIIFVLLQTLFFYPLPRILNEWLF